LKNESPDLTSILTSNKDPEGIQKGVYYSIATYVEGQRHTCYTYREYSTG